MDVAIIIGSYPADQNIKKNLLELGFNKKGNLHIKDNLTIHEFDQRCLEIQIPSSLKADLLVYATIHQSASGTPSLTCHSPGNFGIAKDGGESHKLSIAPASYLREFFLALKKKNLDTEVTLEATHHGPTINRPVIFVEIGSGEEQWSDESLGKIMAETILEVFTKEYEHKSCFVIGGGHYNPVAMKVNERTDYAVGHICPKHNIEHLTTKLVDEALEKTLPKADLIVVDWKGVGPHKDHIKQILEGKNWVKAKSLWPKQ